VDIGKATVAYDNYIASVRKYPPLPLLHLWPLLHLLHLLSLLPLLSLLLLLSLSPLFPLPPIMPALSLCCVGAGTHPWPVHRDKRVFAMRFTEHPFTPPIKQVTLLNILFLMIY
jgi:hypothetical protein